MNVMVIGSGAREHALSVRLAAESPDAHLLCVPGNPGASAVARIVNADLSNTASLAELAVRERVDFTIVGPEAPLSIGVVDRFAAANLPIFGPSALAARLESSKSFAKMFMQRHAVPTARFRVCADVETALACIRSDEFGFPLVLKADGLAAGKGVVIADDRPTAEAAARAAMTDARFGAAGATVVIEECLTGPEVSFFVISDGERAVPIGSAQDHKRIFDDDRGPNTGGMGAFAPSPLVNPALHSRVMRDIVEPVISGMAAEGYPFAGFLYVGLMLTGSGPKVIEFNVRLGDPEAQVILPLIDEPLLPILMAAARGQLSQSSVRIGRDKHVGVVFASRGYPETSESGRPIVGIADAERITGVSVYHAGTAMRDGQLVCAGGRVLTVVGRGSTYAQAIECAYSGVARISFDGMQYRRDIGRSVIDRA